jgi:phosphoribosyl 1,2-cyclic phosphate phosphodiesterase
MKNPVPVKKPRSKDIGGKLIVLGCGTSVGVPTIGCSCPVCLSGDPRNKRTRCSVIFGLPDGNLLIDTSPDMRTQLLREGLGIVNAVAYTHEHSDHVMGFDDLRLMQFYLGGPVPVWCNAAVRSRLIKAFDYAFSENEATHAGAVPSVTLHPIDGPFEVCGATVVPIPLEHGPHFSVLGFRVGNVAYCTDVKTIPESSKRLLQGLDSLILSALRPEPHPTHMNIDEAIVAARELGAGQTWFTHCSCRIDYERVNSSLPPGFGVAWDGQAIPLT